MTSPSSEDGDQSAAVAVTVVRTGGIAGLRREWHAEAADDDAPRWLALIEGCPWTAAALTPAVGGADRYVWHIRARCGYEERGAELPDSAVQGPWRTLVDQVREESERLR